MKTPGQDDERRSTVVGLGAGWLKSPRRRASVMKVRLVVALATEAPVPVGLGLCSLAHARGSVAEFHLDADRPGSVPEYESSLGDGQRAELAPQRVVLNSSRVIFSFSGYALTHFANAAYFLGVQPPRILRR